MAWDDQIGQKQLDWLEVDSHRTLDESDLGGMGGCDADAETKSKQPDQQVRMHKQRTEDHSTWLKLQGSRLSHLPCCLGLEVFQSFTSRVYGLKCSTSSEMT